MNLIEALLNVESFEHPWVFAFLALLPISYLYRLLSKQPQVEHFLFPNTDRYATQACPSSALPSHRRGYLRIWNMLRHSRRFALLVGSHLCLCLAFVFVTCALAGPYGKATLTSYSEGLDIMFVLDMSSSMKAYDAPKEELEARTLNREPLLNRFESAIDTIRHFVTQASRHCTPDSDTPRCDRLGLVVFGNQAYLDIPLTTNYDMIHTRLASRALDDIPSLQTAIGDGIMRAVASLRHSPSQSKVIILLTDGDRRGGRISITQSLQAASTYAVRIYPVLVGNEHESYVAVKQYGSIVYQKANYPTNFELLNTIAAQSGGQAFRSLNASELMQVLDEILDTLEKSYHPDPTQNRLDYTRVFLMLTFIMGLLGCAVRVAFARIYPEP